MPPHPKRVASPQRGAPSFFLDGTPAAGYPYRHMSHPHSPQPEPPEEVTDMAYLLVTSAVRRGMEYEEFTFEMEDGPDDGTEYKVVIMRI